MKFSLLCLTLTPLLLSSFLFVTEADATGTSTVRRRRRVEPDASTNSEYCLEVTLTGTMGGPWVFNGLGKICVCVRLLFVVSSLNWF